jgi:3-phenylpropionate/trans-cinnamate dioxygenase ferredoxin reductase subunit
MATTDRILIIGGGLAGANAAFALRERGFAGRVTIVGEEAELPYERPPLSKAFLRGEDPFEKSLVRPVEEYEAKRIELVRSRRVTAIDRARRVAVLDDGSTLPYDSLLIATGSAPQLLHVPGADLDGVHYLRDVGDAVRIRDHAARASSVVVVGGGWIGSEVAASLRQIGAAVTMVTARERPLEHVLGPEVADVYATTHRDNGIRLLQGKVTALAGSQVVEAAVLDDGTSIPADMVVVGVGAAPRIEIARDAGLEMDGRWIAVDQRLRTSDPRVFAAGDVTSAFHPHYGHRIHVEHWDNAIEQGKSAAASMLGANEPYERIPYFYSDQFDLGMEYRGLATTWDRVIVRGDVGRREFHAFWLESDKVLAAMNVNLWDDGEQLQRIVESGDPSLIEELSHPQVAVAA